MQVSPNHLMLLQNNLPLYMYILHQYLLENERQGEAQYMLNTYINVASHKPESVTSIKRNHKP